MSTKVFQVVELISGGSITYWVTASGKILETHRQYESGLQSIYILDPCVDVDPQYWVDANSSFADLYWLTDEVKPYSVTEVEYAYSFDEPQASKSLIGDRVVVSPMALLARMGKPAVSVA